jgi:hypothetical protein
VGESVTPPPFADVGVSVGADGSEVVVGPRDATVGGSTAASGELSPRGSAFSPVCEFIRAESVDGCALSCIGADFEAAI